MNESQNIEYKESWRDEYLKWICGFANAQGGKIYIGIADNHEIIGVADAKKLMDDIPNKIINLLGLVADVNLYEKDSKQYIEIVVEPSPMPIAFHGTYHYRSGSTKQELKGVSLQQFLLKKMGRSWDDLPHDRASLDCIDRNAIDYFLKSSANRNRLQALPDNADTLTVLNNLHLVTDDGKLKYAALLLFSKDPLLYFPAVQFKLGRFGNNSSELLFDDIIEGNILEMTDKVIRILESKYLISPIHYDGIYRVESLEIPEAALREMICNAIVHKDYQSVPIQLKVYNERIELWNPGGLPEGFSVETLFAEHHSHARNRNIAHVFYRAGLIEAWGRGIEKICIELAKSSLKPPKFEEKQGGICVVVTRKIAPSTAQVPPKYRPSTAQVDALMTIMGSGEYSVTELMKLLNLTHRRNFTKFYLKAALERGLIEPLYPNRPKHPKQKYHRKK